MAAKNFEDKLKNVIGRYVENSTGDHVREVTSWREDKEYGGYCDTCSYEETIVHVSYINHKFENKSYTYNGSFIDFVGGLIACSQKIS